MPRMLEKPITPVPLAPNLTIHADRLHPYLHGRSMSVRISQRPPPELELGEADSQGNCSLMVGFEKVCFFNNLYERRGRSEVDGGLSRNFTESVGPTSNCLGS